MTFWNQHGRLSRTSTPIPSRLATSPGHHQGVVEQMVCYFKPEDIENYTLAERTCIGIVVPAEPHV